MNPLSDSISGADRHTDITNINKSCLLFILSFKKKKSAISILPVFLHADSLISLVIF